MSLATNREPIILIGPLKGGKTTVGKLLAERLQWPFVSLDRLERHYAQQIGFDPEMASAIQASQGDLAWYSYRRRFFGEVVLRFLAEHREGVLELGGGHPILPEATEQRKLNDVLAGYRNVVLLMPSANIQESLAFLKSRQKPEHLNPDLNDLLLDDRRFFDLARFVIYTQGKLPPETCDEIISLLDLAHT